MICLQYKHYICMMKIEWKTQARLAKELGITTQAVHNWIQRGNKKVKTKHCSVTGKTLVRLAS